MENSLIELEILSNEQRENSKQEDLLFSYERLICSTKTLCPSCRKVITAQKVERDGFIYLIKNCVFEHKVFESLLEKANHSWQEKEYDNLKYRMSYDVRLGQDKFSENNIINLNKASSVFFLITQKCNSNCPVCFDKKWLQREDMSAEFLKEKLKIFKHKKIYLDGGEPTVREDLPELIRLIKKSGNFPGIVTNGLKISDIGYLQKLVGAGLKFVFISFDGFKTNIYQLFRNDATQYEKKLKALDNLRKMNICTTILSTIVRGVNDDQIPHLVEYASQNRHIWLLSLRYLNLYGVNETRNFGKENLMSIEEMMVLVNNSLGITVEQYNLFYEARYYFHELISFFLPNVNIDQPENRRIHLKRGEIVTPVFSESELKELIDIFKHRKIYKLLKPKYLSWIGTFIKNRFELGLLEEDLHRKNIFSIGITRPPLMLSDFPLTDPISDIVYFPDSLPVFAAYPS